MVSLLHNAQVSRLLHATKPVHERFRAFSRAVVESHLNTAGETVHDEALLSPGWINSVEQHCRKRKKSVVDFQHLRSAAEELRHYTKSYGFESDMDETDRECLWRKYMQEIMKLPNSTHPVVEARAGDNEVLLETVGKQRDFAFIPASFERAVEKLNGLRITRLDHLCPERSYYFAGLLADLERFILCRVLETVKQHGFELLAVPESVDPAILEACGMIERGEHNQIYRVLDRDHGELALAGTSEMTIAAYLADRCFSYAELPKKFVAVSRCFRAEISGAVLEKGIYRVHEFTKVEMFAVTSCEHVDAEGICDESEAMLQEIVDIQKSILNDLDVHALVYDMPPSELGLPAFRKIDIEAWMPGRNHYGEITSASNCTDYQARRLNITYKRNGDKKFCHTLNGTACAVPRLLLSFVEQHQLSDGGFQVPASLQSAFGAKIVDRTPYIMNVKFRRPVRSDPIIGGV